MVTEAKHYRDEAKKRRSRGRSIEALRATRELKTLRLTKERRPSKRVDIDLEDHHDNRDH